MTEHDAIRQAAEAWMAMDPDPETRAAAAQLLADDDAVELAGCFGRPLQFGTAGLRGLIGPGPGRMNRANVMRVTAGLAAYLGQTVPRARERGVVIGHDARRGSEVFAADAAGVLSAAGFRVIVCPRHAPTPLVAFALLQCKAAAGIVVTASHNPPAYNGYKVYWDNGAQIIPPHDVGIASAIAAVTEPPARDQHRVESAPASLIADFQAAIAAQAEVIEVPAGAPAVDAVYTALHGVAGSICEATMAGEGLRVHSVAEQAQPDGAFPTVAFPNPEEDGALDLAVALADEVGSDLVIANDPDGDRLSVAVRWDGAIRQLTGDEIGALLGDALLGARGAVCNQAERAFVVRTIVSSELLERVAAHHGARCVETLTGFKWIWNKGLDLIGAGDTFVFGYEEAIGFSCGTAVRDKDGIGAAAVLARIARSGRGIRQRLIDIWARHGYVGTRQKSIVDAEPGGVERHRQRMRALRAAPPTEVSGVAVTRTRDFAAGGDLPPTNCFALWLADGSRIMLRPSGTEPKLKIYMQVDEVWSDGAQIAAQKRLDALQNDVVKLVLRA